MKKSDAIAAILAGILISAFIGAIIMLSWREIPKTNEQLLTYMLGQLSGFVSAAVAMYFVRRADGRPSGAADDPLSVAGPSNPGSTTPVITEDKGDGR